MEKERGSSLALFIDTINRPKLSFPLSVFLPHKVIHTFIWRTEDILFPAQIYWGPIPLRFLSTPDTQQPHAKPQVNRPRRQQTPLQRTTTFIQLFDLSLQRARVASG